MQLYDFAGERIRNGWVKKTFGGDIDSRGLPPMWEIPTAGEYAGVVVSDLTDGPYTSQYFGKVLTRPAGSPGKIRVQGPVLRSTYGTDWIETAAWLRGLGSGSVSLKVGLISEDGQSGVYIEHSGAQGFITRLKGGVVTRQAIALGLNGTVTHAQLGLVLTRDVRATDSTWLEPPTPRDWTVTVQVEGGLRESVSGDREIMDVSTVRPFVEWDYGGASELERTICAHTASIAWQQ